MLQIEPKKRCGAKFELMGAKDLHSPSCVNDINFLLFISCK